MKKSLQHSLALQVKGGRVFVINSLRQKWCWAMALVPALVLGTVSLSWSFPFSSEQYPFGNAYDRKQAEPAAPEGAHRSNEMGVPFRPSLNPQITDQYNEPHPFPEYMKKFLRAGGYLPEYYRDLLMLEPEDNVQSKIFDAKAFQEIRRIGVYGFENKTYDPFKDERAATVVTDQMYKALMSATEYTLISPVKMDELAFRLKIQVAPPASVAPPKSKESPAPAQPQVDARLPFTDQDMDAVMVGAVTKFMDSYRDRQGQLQKSLSPGVEFGAFLISTKTGNVIWAARYVGGQQTGLLSLFREGETPLSWVDKEEVSRRAMKRVIKAFHKTQDQQQ
jgi:hypothetical protein